MSVKTRDDSKIIILGLFSVKLPTVSERGSALLLLLLLPTTSSSSLLLVMTMGAFPF
jgi:hypothetical protein